MPGVSINEADGRTEHLVDFRRYTQRVQGFFALMEKA